MDGLERKEWKQRTKAFVKSQGMVMYGIALMPLLLSGISFLVDGIALLELAISVLAMVVSVLMPVIYLRVKRGDAFRLDSHVFGEGQQNFLAYFLLALLQSIYVGLWSLLFALPAIIGFVVTQSSALLYALTPLVFFPITVTTFAYLLAPYIQHDHPDWSPNAVLKESVRLTKGKKGQLLLLNVSYYLLPNILFMLAGVFGFATVAQMMFFMMVRSAGPAFYVTALFTLLTFLGGAALGIRALPHWHTLTATLYDEWKE